MAASTWSEFHIAIISNDSTLFPSFSSKQLTGGDADKIVLADIRKYAAVSNKLRFTADGKTVIGDDTTLAYYMALRGDSVDGSNKGKDNKEASGEAAVAANPEGGSDSDAGRKSTIKTIQVDLILNKAGGSGGDSKKPNPPVDPAKIQETIDKIIDNMRTDGGVQLGDLTRLSESLGALQADSMKFAGEASKINYPEPLDLTELQWDVVFKNNRALHGWYYKGNLLVKARKRAFQLQGISGAVQSQAQASKAPKTSGNGEKDMTPSNIDPLPPVPPFYVCDDASVQVTEMTSALEKTMASQGFSSTAIRAAGGGGAMGIQATASLAIETEHSTASKSLKAEQVSALNVAYKFPRAAVELDAYCLELTEECKRDALACRNTADVDRWQRDYGSAFATQFTLGGELISSRLFHGKDDAQLSAFKDSTKIAAGASLTTPYGSGSTSYGSTETNEGSQGQRSAQQSLRLAWEARGGNTLLCSNPPVWMSTVKDYRLWRIMDQQAMVRMIDLVKSVHPKSGAFLENPESASKRESDPEGARKQTWALLNTALKDTGRNPTADKVKAFYESSDFKLDEFNKSLEEDEKELALAEKTSWPKLSLEQKVLIGMFGYEKGFIVLA
ncbi:hypothetical protein F5Y19DRAFT_448905 [Xylariaceae sp. FL1651]|nr:hypothetical protein F5Y19DRAFT_448905 [Xylariaceae sp. FL1651]